MYNAIEQTVPSREQIRRYHTHGTLLHAKERRSKLRKGNWAFSHGNNSGTTRMPVGVRRGTLNMPADQLFPSKRPERKHTRF